MPAYEPGCPQVAVIILNWNGERLLKEFLPKVVAHTPESLGRIIVADNGSTDGSVKLLKEKFPEVEVLEFSENYGFAEGYNRALAATRYPLTVLLNSDVAPAEGWLEPLANFMNSHPEAAGCQPKLLSYTDPFRFEYAGASGGFLDRNGYPYCRGRIFGQCETDSGQYDTPVEVDWATGAALMVRTALYLEAGGLDPSFFAHMEEIDLCWRMRLAGHKLFAVPASVCYHLGGGSLPASNPRKTYLNFRNNLLMLHKNLPVKVRKRKLIVRRLLDTVAWAQFVITGQWSNARALFKAHRDFARMRANYAGTAATDNLLDGRPNILTQFYLRGKKTFAKL
ncbi:MAG: glycosyltransferase family 2 protein [Muribaculaceae bacterium]|nr:glycosyltransferase family 2 protein [Muribaculaceae bacterium]